MASSADRRISGRPAATVTASAALGIKEFMTHRGLDADQMFHRVGLQREEVGRTGNRILLAQFCDLFEHAAIMADRPDIGLEFGESFQPEYLGFLGYLATRARTLGEGLRNFARFLPLHQQATFAALEPCFGDRIAFSYAITDDDIRSRRQDAELSLAVMLNLLSAALGGDWRPDEVHFAHARPAGGASRHERIFGAPLHFEQGRNAIVFDRALLNTPMPRRDPVLFNLIRTDFEKLDPRARGRADPVALARHNVGRLLREGRCRLPDLAMLCNMPSWTLKRQLHKSGLTFQQLVAEVRQSLAIEYLVDHGLSITDTALSLGYSEVSAFSRAFRQWTGMSASEYVNRQPEA